jgi:hypothetical protein
MTLSIRRQSSSSLSTSSSHLPLSTRPATSTSNTAPKTEALQALEAKLATLRQAVQTQVSNPIAETTTSADPVLEKAPKAQAPTVDARQPRETQATENVMKHELQDFGRLLIDVQTLGEQLGTTKEHLSDEAIHRAWYWGESLFADYKV